MNDNYEPIIYTLTDEEGNNQQFELLDSMDIDNQTYYALIPHSEDPKDLLSESGELIVLKSVFEGDEELWATIDDDDEYETIGNIFLEKLNELFE